MVKPQSQHSGGRGVEQAGCSYAGDGEASWTAPGVSSSLAGQQWQGLTILISMRARSLHNSGPVACSNVQVGRVRPQQQPPPQPAGCRGQHAGLMSHGPTVKLCLPQAPLWERTSTSVTPFSPSMSSLSVFFFTFDLGP
ncbi:unnamed protein product [Gadus morhua 'NCC']